MAGTAATDWSTLGARGPFPCFGFRRQGSLTFNIIHIVNKLHLHFLLLQGHLTSEILPYTLRLSSNLKLSLRKNYNGLILLTVLRIAILLYCNWIFCCSVTKLHSKGLRISAEFCLQYKVNLPILYENVLQGWPTLVHDNSHTFQPNVTSLYRNKDITYIHTPLVLHFSKYFITKQSIFLHPTTASYSSTTLLLNNQ